MENSQREGVMAIETFTWNTEAQADGDVAFAQRSTQFGDGYKQIAGEGLNNESQTWPISTVQLKAEALKVAAFLRRHKDGKAFLWTPPLGELGLYTCAGFKPINAGGAAWRIAATFETAYHP
jgi:phage-related protein